MSRFEFKLPDIGEGVMEGEIVKWLVQPGDAIAEDQPMVEVMTDKATVTITSPKTGKVVEVAGAEGAVIPVHAVLVVLELAGDKSAADDAPAPAPVKGPASAAPDKKDDGPAATAVGDIRETLPGMGGGGATASKAVSPKASAAQSGYYNAKPLATPATRKLARELDVDLRKVRPSGPHDRVVKGDVRQFAGGSTGSVAGLTAGTTGARTTAFAPIAVASHAPDLEERRPLRGMRKRIFDAMARSKHTAAHFTFVEECDVSRLRELRERLKPAAAEQGVKLTYLSFFVKAVVVALKRHPMLNSAYDETTNEIVERRYHNVGIASSTKGGLMVPVIKNADRLSIMDVAREITRLSESTKSGKVAPADLQGSTFTITSLGQQGGLFATPILNTPEVGILGLHQMKQKPVVRDGAIVIGDVMLLSLSFDHRLIDGHVGAAFAYEIIRLIEEPDRLWLEM